MNPSADFIQDPRLYVQIYIKQNNVTITPSGSVFSPKCINAKEVYNTLYIDYAKDVQSYNAAEREKAASKRNLCREQSDRFMSMVFQEYISLVRAAHRERLIQSLVCENENLSLVENFVKAVTGRAAPEDVAVIAHWMWSVKVKINNKLPTYHIMPVFFGPQEGGKTNAIRKLLAPLEEYKLNISLDQMTDERNYASMATNYVIFFDEMERADRVDIDSLKKQITLDYNDYRPLHTNSIQRAKQSCSFIGATNRQLAEQIVDSTGMRRFWQVNCLPVLDWEKINNLNSLEMWRGIDENKENGYLLDQHKTIKARQAELIQNDEFDLFIQEKNLTIVDGESQEVDNKILYADYKIWAADNGYKGQNSNWFTIRMKGKGMHNKVCRQKGYKNIWTVSSNYVSSFNNGPENKHLKAVK